MSKLDDNDSTIINLIKVSVQKCYANDKYLIDNKMEQASVARIFYYMQDYINTDDKYKEFKKLNLDSEYNKYFDNPKILEHRPNGSRPDLILHERNTLDKDTFVIEFKAADNDCSEDFEKLVDYTKAPYSYVIGVSCLLNKDKPIYKYYKQGEEAFEKNGNVNE